MVVKKDKLWSMFVDLQEDNGKIHDELKVLDLQYRSLQRRVVELLEAKQKGIQNKLVGE